ncbi:glycosyl hydrolase family 28-related protein [Inquilinus sp. CA228]|uniref:glycosyl hydrolase family 28-related protein n=1 Tax=Inquilinus sp. CA228 TaxID=3455609 RepID=UPI003F8D07B3
MATVALSCIETVADLAALEGSGAALVLGYHRPGDGGGGQFYWDAKSEAPEDGGLAFRGSASAGRWIRLAKGAVDVRWFGALGDGATDDTDAVQRAFDTNRAIYLSSGTYLVGNLRFGTNQTDGQQSMHGPGIEGDGRGSRLKAKPGTQGFVLNAQATAGLLLRAFVVDGNGQCGGIDTGWPKGLGKAQMNRYENIWIENYAGPLGWQALHNEDSSFVGCVVGRPQPAESDATAISAFCPGGPVSFDRCIWYGAKLVIDCQNALFSACGGHGIEVLGRSINLLSFNGCYLYSNAKSGRVVWTDPASKGHINNITSRGSIWIATGKERDVAIFGGRYFAGIDSTGDEFVTDGKGTKGRVLDEDVANHSGQFVARADFRHVTFGLELAITDPSSGAMKASFQNCRAGGLNVADRLYIGNPSTQRVLLEPNGLDVSNAATPDTRFRMFDETRTVAGGEWQPVFDQPMTQGSGQVYIVSRAGQGPALHARLTRATGEEKADQMSVLQDQNAADGGKIEMRWLAGKSPEFRVNGTGKIVVEIVSESMGH